MQIFVTGGTGFIGRAVVQELLSHGYQVSVLVRTDHGAEAVRKAGAVPVTGNLEDHQSLKTGAMAADGVIHLAFEHDLNDFARPTQVDRAAIEAIGAALSGTTKPFVIASGTFSLSDGTGRVATEHSSAVGQGPFLNRALSRDLLFKLSRDGGFRGIAVLLSPTVHGKEDHVYIPMLMKLARKNGFVAYVDDGTSVWPAVHRFDAAVLFRLALEKGADGANYHAVAEQAIRMKDIMTVIGKKMGLPLKSLPLPEAEAALGFFARGIATNNPVSSEWTQLRLGWRPTNLGLLEDIEQNYPIDF